MFYSIKTKIMEKGIKKKQLDKPFDYEFGENYQLEKNSDITINNSYYFSAHSYEKKKSLYCRLGIRSEFSEVWMCYIDGNNKYYFEDMIQTTNIPLKIWKEDNVWNIKFVGMLLKNKKDQVRCTLEAQFESNEQPIDFFSHMLPIRTAKAMAQEKWNKTFFNEVQNNNQVHYEQTGVLKGKMLLEGQHISIDLPCVRDHSYGKRDWNYMNNHMWIMAVNEKSQLNFSMVSYPTLSILEVGNFKTMNGEMKFLQQATYERSTLLRGIAPDNLNILIQFEDKEEIGIHVKKIEEITYTFQDGDYILIEGIAEFLIDGVQYRGILEVGFNKDKKRWFNNKKIKELKV